jgi:hypothetical protein
MVVELKADYLPLKVEDCYQGYNYATWSRAKLFAISNGKVLQVYKTIEEELPLKLQPVNDIPLAKDILDDKKLNDALAKTKEFTGDEFAKLLFKFHNIIRNNDKLDPADSFDEISKILFIKFTRPYDNIAINDLYLSLNGKYLFLITIVPYSLDSIHIIFLSKGRNSIQTSYFNAKLIVCGLIH